MADPYLLQQFAEMFPQLGNEVIAQILLMTRNDPQKTLAVAMQVLDQAQKEEESEEETYDDIEDPRSIVIPVREYESKCGYCKNKEKTSISYGMTAARLTVQDYQSLIDRGWRRSGTWLYKPTLNKTCCPQYTIRLDVHSFKPSKTHKKILNKTAKYLQTGKIPKKVIPDDSEMDTQNTKSEHTPTESNSNVAKPPQPPQPAIATPEEQHKMDLITKALIQAIQDAVDQKLLPWPEVTSATLEAVARVHIPTTPKQRKQCEYFSNVAVDIFQHIKNNAAQLNPPKIAAILANKILQVDSSIQVHPAGTFLNFGKGQDIPQAPSHEKRPTQDHTNQAPKKPKKMQSTTQPQTTPSQPDPNANNNNNQTPKNESHSEDRIDTLLHANGLHKLELSLKRSEFIEEEFKLYCKYQKAVHHDKDEKLTPERYTNFLVESPLIYEPASPSKPAPECGYGSFHQQYRIDGQLVAVGVIDILPLCVSSVYFFYDPEYQFLTPGVFSALQEIHLTQKFSSVAPKLHYYYLGFYIHSCEKMRYKGQYKPSDLLCPESFQWRPLSESLPILEVTKYSKLAKDAPSEVFNPKLVSQIPLLYKKKIYYLSSFSASGQKQLRPSMEAYLKVVGPDMADKLLFVIK